MCVFLKEKMTTSVYCWCLCQVQLVGLVCLPPFLDQGFSRSAPGYDDPPETLPSKLEGLYTTKLQNITLIFHTILRSKWNSEDVYPSF